ncbi:MAG: type II secretion system protein N [Gammaproteobacteria bacterium]|nr:type II secretion system protein N [Gammaproteobacteria bacterium]MBT8111543.1 type II secretion system protein N [Gammaproteobacteria bacterium]NND47060.1 type II secretion system protein N [Woeseiaceae bacterium]NNL46241.1 type II secretion system protein N [Woeseiaceae bacterium]
MIDTKRGLLLVAVLTLALALIVLFPARVAYHWAAPPELAASGIHGTVWNGKADAVAMDGIYLSDVSWLIRPMHLFTGKLVYRVKGAPLSGFVEANVGIGIGGTLTVSDLNASLPLLALAQTLRVRGLSGDASLQFERIQMRDGLPITAIGTVQVRNLMAPSLSSEPIGGYRAEFFTQNNGVAASVEDTDGVLDLAGSLQIKADRSYEFIAQLIAKPETPAGLRKQMQYLGPADERGQQELRVEGRL